MIHLVVALAAEARPLISHFQLQKVDELEPLNVYRRPDLALVVTGVGREATNSGITALAEALPPEALSVWVNVGVAGHRDHEIGAVVLASRVQDADSGALYEMTPPGDLHLPRGEIRTIAHVETQYETDALYEMEAAAFCQSTADLTSNELIQVLKIVSDNRRTGTLCVSARQVQGLVEDSLPKIDLLLSSLHRHAHKLSQ